MSPCLKGSNPEIAVATAMRVTSGGARSQMQFKV